MAIFLGDRELMEVKCGNNFGYIVEEKDEFAYTDYKMLMKQNTERFVPCMRVLFNGNVELYYVAEYYQTFSAVIRSASKDMVQRLVVELLACVADVMNNGFLSVDKLNLDWDKIFVEPETLRVRLVYIPVRNLQTEHATDFEKILRQSIIEMLQRTGNGTLSIARELVNQQISIQQICEKYMGNLSANYSVAPAAPTNGPEQRNYGEQTGDILYLLGTNLGTRIEIPLTSTSISIGKKQGLVDVVLPSNMVSRRHCVIQKSKGRWLIVDQGSTNGTFLNGQQLLPQQFAEFHRGDVLHIANCEFRVV